MNTFTVAAVTIAAVTIAGGAAAGYLLFFSRAMREAAPAQNRARRTTAAWFSMAFGGGLTLAALVAALHTWHFARTAARTTGTVVEMREAENDGCYAPVFRFMDKAGNTHTVSSSLYSAPPEFHVGDSVGVLYSGAKPDNAVIDSWWQAWGLSTLLGVLGTICLTSGFILHRWHRITARFKQTTAAKVAG